MVKSTGAVAIVFATERRHYRRIHCKSWIW